MHKLRVLIAEANDPYFNLATEEWIFRNLDLNTHTLFLWRNSESVFIGRSQNPWLECQMGQLEADGVDLIRRSSGGGTVYHDLGNTNFTFLCAKNGYQKKNNSQIITTALEHLGIQSYASGRSDIVLEHIDGTVRKISGSAFRETRDRAYHHGTMLINADLTRLRAYLAPCEKQLVAKGVKSHRASVINLEELSPDITHAKFCDALINAFFNFYTASCDVETLQTASLRQIPELMHNYELYQAWDWRFGKTLDFEQHLQQEFSWGDIAITLHIHKGYINSINIISNALPDAARHYLCDRLTGLKYHRTSVATLLQQKSLPQEPLSEILHWISRAIA